MGEDLLRLLREIAGLPPERPVTQEIVEETWSRLLSKSPRPPALVQCPDCGGRAFLEGPCERPGCDGGYVLACANCGVEAVDPLRAPFCSSACEEEHAAKAKLEAIREARR